MNQQKVSVVFSSVALDLPFLGVLSLLTFSVNVSARFLYYLLMAHNFLTSVCKKLSFFDYVCIVQLW